MKPPKGCNWAQPAEIKPTQIIYVKSSACPEKGVSSSSDAFTHHFAPSLSWLTTSCTLQPSRQLSQRFSELWSLSLMVETRQNCVLLLRLYGNCLISAFLWSLTLRIMGFGTFPSCPCCRCELEYKTNCSLECKLFVVWRWMELVFISCDAEY